VSLDGVRPKQKNAPFGRKVNFGIVYTVLRVIVLRKTNILEEQLFSAVELSAS
jgi:hypothetical protein